MTELLETYEPEAAALVAAEAVLELIGDGFVFTEGPVWDFEAGELVFSDIPGDAMYRYRPGEGISDYRRPSNFSNGMTIDAQGRLVVCEHQTRRVVRGSATAGFEVVADSYDGSPLNAPNDVVVAPDGSIVFTDPHYGLGEGFGGPAEQVLGHRGVYRVPPDGGEPELLIADFDGPNGLAIDARGTRLFVDDTERAHIRVFEIGANWQLTGGEVFVELSGDGDGVLDGLKLDQQGNMWSTGPGGIWLVNNAGAVIGRIRVPVVAANLAWGDADAGSLYITASERLYRLETRVTGHVPYRTNA